MVGVGMIYNLSVLCEIQQLLQLLLQRATDFTAQIDSWRCCSNEPLTLWRPWATGIRTLCPLYSGCGRTLCLLLCSLRFHNFKVQFF